METWLIGMIFTISLLFLLKPILSLHLKTKKLPPGPITIPIISGLLWLLKPFWVFESTIRNLHAHCGPTITLPIGFRPAIFISNRSLAHQAFNPKWCRFRRPPAGRATSIFTINQYNISSAVYGPKNSYYFDSDVVDHGQHCQVSNCPGLQERLVAEIRGVLVAEETDQVKGEDLQKMPYLKAVVLEGLRRHPQSHFLLPHSAIHDVVLEGHVVPKNGTVNFMVADIGLDPEVWEDPMEFKPERFLNEGGEGDEGFDITGSREIKMMPFWVGRRICALALVWLCFISSILRRFGLEIRMGGRGC